MQRMLRHAMRYATGHAFAATGPKRIAFLPNVPAMNETLKGFEVVNYYGVVAPAGTLRRVIERLQGESVKAMSHAETRDKFIAQGADPVDSNPKAFGAFMMFHSHKADRTT